jgi:iron complex outermembrane receptor protein
MNQWQLPRAVGGTIALFACPFFSVHATAQEAPGRDPARAGVETTRRIETAESSTMPMTKSVVSRENLDAQSPQDGYEALKNVAGVTSSNSKGSVNDSLNVRGINANLFTSYRLNGGLPIATVIATPSEDKERIEALKGANALMFGIASPAGIINLVTKRAGARDVTSLSLTGNGFGQYGAAVDLGRKFGAERQFGVRVNLAGVHIENGVIGANGHSQLGSVAADWKVNRKLAFRMDLEHYSKDAVEQGSISLLKAVNGVIAIPRIPDPRQLLSGPWAHYIASTTNTMFGAALAIADGWDLVAEAGRSNSDRARRLSRVGNYNVITGAGVNSITVIDDQQYVNTYYKTELKGRFSTGSLLHELTAGVASNQRDSNVPSSTTTTTTQNIYHPFAVAEPPPQKLPLTYLPQSSHDVGIYTYDSLGNGGDWRLLLGMRQTIYRADNATNKGGEAITTTRTPSPALGFLYDIAPRTTVYTSFMKGLEETGIAAVGTANQFTTLAPAAARQTELGVRTAYFKGVNLSAAYFNITRANAVTDARTNVFLLDGTTNLRGIESTMSADLNRWWTINAAGQVMRAVQHSTIDLSISGLTPENTPELTGNVSVTHRASWLPGLTLNAGAAYVGPRFINPKDEGKIPGVTLFSAGAGYATGIQGHKVVFRLSLDNLADKRYWNSVAGNAYGAGMVRAVKMSAKIDL